MVPAFLLMIREGLEASLIVGILAAYLVRIGRRDALPRVWAGVLAALGLSIVVGLLIVLTIGNLPGVVQETTEGLAGLLAVAVLTWMLFWMRRQGRALKGELEHDVDVALTAGSTAALVGLAFVAVAREGLETVLFFVAVISSAGAGLPTFVGALVGLAIAVGIGGAIFLGGIRVNLRRFFTVTGTVLIFVAAGLVAFSIHEFGEGGLIANSGTAFNFGGVLPETDALGSLLAGLFGYRSKPTPLELIGYLAYLIPVLALFVADGRVPFRRQPAAA
jgi:high-affinity iron transporter